MQEKNLYKRYGRQMILKGFGDAGQQKLLRARLLVIGAGGLGCPALQYLVAAGVGTIGIVDDDAVTLSNLHRQILYSVDDIGLAKAEVAALKLGRLNPEVTIIPYSIRLGPHNALDVIRQYDLVVDGTDNFASRYMINDACVLLGKPLIYGAVSQYEGQVAVFNVNDKSGHKVDYRDLFPEPPREGEVANCEQAGVLGVLPGIIGTMQAAEAIKLITGIGTPLLNRLVTYNVLTNEMYEISLTTTAAGNGGVPKNEAAFLSMNYSEACDAEETSVIEIGVEQFRAISRKPSAVIIDVREKGELPLLTGFEHRQIPMSVFRKSIGSIKNDTIILFCQHGIRSLYAAELVEEVFGTSKEVYSLKGGIIKWGDELGIQM